MQTADARYPIGRFRVEGEITPERRREWIAAIAATPARFRVAVDGLSPEQLDTPYREGGWTVRQLVHHLADSHMNAYIRVKLALTEEGPTVKTYDEALWAALPDSRITPPAVSLTILDALHARWVDLLGAVDEAQWRRTIRHPEWGEIPLEMVVAQYAWHGDHHVAHVTALRERMGW
ncbi:MAG: hypothetical protein AVDCRST_MAG68-4322 [uncultured Gemmatimonadetes bacterium]|uniref:DinB-like domain-containing protein n=1 Tax=uncultured Gemmatimonadota bacterium TaxID=203437 RepID=A0A6J4MHV4_9BACT|nr:MAG: hypothetical protein AVDCRST_MAG68-4322 [uncultured Gemmatimonadota bacterium]